MSGGGAGASCCFDRVAVLPVVEALAGLLAELALGDLVLAAIAAGRASAVETGFEHLGDVQADVEADLVGKLDRPHRHAEVFGGLVDGLLLRCPRRA